MTHTRKPDHEPNVDRADWMPGRALIPVLAIAMAIALFAHGCHGPDEDHELFVRPLHSQTSPAGP